MRKSSFFLKNTIKSKEISNIVKSPLTHFVKGDFFQINIKKREEYYTVINYEPVPL